MGLLTASTSVETSQWFLSGKTAMAAYESITKTTIKALRDAALTTT